MRREHASSASGTSWHHADGVVIPQVRNSLFQQGLVSFGAPVEADQMANRLEGRRNARRKSSAHEQPLGPTVSAVERDHVADGSARWRLQRRKSQDLDLGSFSQDIDEEIEFHKAMGITLTKEVHREPTRGQSSFVTLKFELPPEHATPEKMEILRERRAMCRGLEPEQWIRPPDGRWWEPITNEERAQRALYDTEIASWFGQQAAGKKFSCTAAELD